MKYAILGWIRDTEDGRAFGAWFIARKCPKLQPIYTAKEKNQMMQDGLLATIGSFFKSGLSCSDCIKLLIDSISVDDNGKFQLTNKFKSDHLREHYVENE